MHGLAVDALPSRSSAERSFGVGIQATNAEDLFY
jgi:hypothetical protein